MDHFIITPQVGIGNVKIGMSRNEVHEVMGMNFVNTVAHNMVRDNYYDFSFQIHYDKDNIVNYIEITNNPLCRAIVEGIDVFNTKAEYVVSYFNQSSKFIDTLSSRLGFAYIFEDLGLSFYRSNVFKEETRNEPWFLQLSQEQQEDELRFQYFESVSTWKLGYYDSVKPYL